MFSTIGVAAVVYGAFAASRKYRKLRDGGLTHGGAIDSMVKATGSEAAACVGAVCGAVCSATSALVGKLRKKPKCEEGQEDKENVDAKDDVVDAEAEVVKD